MGFTKPARLRMLRSAATFDWKAIGNSTLVTLTYPDDVVFRSPEKRQMDLYLIKRKIEEHLGKPMPGVWRLEWKKRRTGIHKGKPVPHFHLLLFSLPYFPYAKLREEWRKIIGTSSFPQINVTRIREGKVGTFYVMKYCGKAEPASILDNEPNHNNRTGRHYGFMRRALIPKCCKTVIEIHAEQLAFLRRQLLRLCPWIDPRYPGGCTILGDKAKLAREIIRQIDLTPPETL